MNSSFANKRFKLTIKDKVYILSSSVLMSLLVGLGCAVVLKEVKEKDLNNIDESQLEEQIRSR